MMVRLPVRPGGRRQVVHWQVLQLVRPSGRRHGGRRQGEAQLASSVDLEEEDKFGLQCFKFMFKETTLYLTSFTSFTSV